MRSHAEHQGLFFNLRPGARIEEKARPKTMVSFGRAGRNGSRTWKEKTKMAHVQPRGARDMLWSVMPGEFPSPLRGGKLSTSKKQHTQSYQPQTPNQKQQRSSQAQAQALQERHHFITGETRAAVPKREIEVSLSSSFFFWVRFLSWRATHNVAAA
jgi:hypothetical protein